MNQEATPTAPAALVLYPTRADAAPADRETLARTLADAGLTGSEDAGHPGEFVAGAGFFQAIAFLGCSPRVALGADEDPGARVRIRIRIPDRPRYLPGTPRPRPRCPACRRAAPAEEALAAWQADPGATWPCPGCGARTPVPGLDWRREAAFGGAFVEILNVHPHEAVPADALLGALEQATGTPWDFAYRNAGVGAEGPSPGGEGGEG